MMMFNDNIWSWIGGARLSFALAFDGVAYKLVLILSIDCFIAIQIRFLSTSQTGLDCEEFSDLNAFVNQKTIHHVVMSLSQSLTLIYYKCWLFNWYFKDSLLILIFAILKTDFCKQFTWKLDFRKILNVNS